MDLFVLALLCLRLVEMRARLPSVHDGPNGMTVLDSEGYNELKRRFAVTGSVAVVGSSGNMLYRNFGP